MTDLSQYSSGDAERCGSNRLWSVRVYGFEGHPYDPVAVAPTPGAARYVAFKALRETGRFTGRDGFQRFLENGVRVWPASYPASAHAPRIGGRS